MSLEEIEPDEMDEDEDDDFSIWDSGPIYLTSERQDQLKRYTYPKTFK